MVIISILIIMTISIVISMAILRDGIDNASLSLSSISYERARMNAVICLEDTLLRIKKEEQFSSNLSYTFEDGEECATSIGWGTPDTSVPGVVTTDVTLTAVGTSDDFVRTFSYDLVVKRLDVNYVTGELAYMNVISIVSSEELID